MRSTWLALLLASSAALLGCDLLAKLKGGGDAGLDGAVVATTDAATPTVDVVVPDAGAAPAPTTTTTTTPTVHHTAVADAGAKSDASVADAGKPADGGPAPAPTPTLKLPMFDAGAFKFDAGGLKLPWQK